MKKILFSLFSCVWLFSPVMAQPGPLVQAFRPVTDTRPVMQASRPMPADKSKVMDFFQNQQFEEAISYLGPAVGEDSASIPVLGYLGYAYYMLENNKAAQHCYQHIFELDSLNISALHYLEVLHAREDPDMALDFTHRLIDLQPGKSLWWRTRGELQRRLKQPDSAMAALIHAYGLAPEEVKNTAALADLLIEKKNYRQADSIVDLGLAKDSLNFILLKLRARSAYNAKDYNAVLIPGERIMRQNLPDVNAQTWLALSYYNLKRYPDCIRTCEFLLNSGYDLEAVYYYESKALARLQQYKESNELLATCLKKAISPTAAWYYNDLGENHEATKDFKPAMACYDTAYYLFREPLMLYNCGRIAESELKNNTLARKYYTRYLAVAHPDSPEEKKAYAYVKAHWGKGRKEPKAGSTK
jgi:tetratricopeptide (TPR) repeat protein